MAFTDTFDFRFAVGLIAAKVKSAMPETSIDLIQSRVAEVVKIEFKNELMGAFGAQELENGKRGMGHVKWAAAVNAWNQLLPGMPCVYRAFEPFENEAEDGGEPLNVGIGFQIGSVTTLAGILEVIEPQTPQSNLGRQGALSVVGSRDLRVDNGPAEPAIEPDERSPTLPLTPAMLMTPPVTPEKQSRVMTRPTTGRPRVARPRRILQDSPAPTPTRPTGGSPLARKQRPVRQAKAVATAQQNASAKFRLPAGVMIDLNDTEVRKCPAFKECKSCHVDLSPFSLENRAVQANETWNARISRLADIDDTDDAAFCRYTQYSGGEIPAYNDHSTGEVPWPAGAQDPSKYCKEETWREVTKTLGFDFLLREDPVTDESSVFLADIGENHMRPDKWCAMAFIQRLAEDAKDPQDRKDAGEDILYDRLTVPWNVVKEEVCGAIRAYNERH